MKVYRKSVNHPIHANIKELHQVFYGNTSMERMFCADCQSMTLVVGGNKLCCDSPMGSIQQNDTVEMIVSPHFQRRSLKRKERDLILEEQENNCFWCGREFGTIYTRGPKVYMTKIHFDHLIPYVYSANNHSRNIVAACNLCNLTKGSRVFRTVEEARSYIMQKLASKGVIFDAPSVFALE